MNNFAIWLLISLAYLGVLINAVPRNSTVDDTDPSVRYLDSKGAVDPDVCIGCGLPRVDSARFFNGTGTVVPGLVEFSFVGTQFLVFVFLTSVSKGTASGVVEIDGTAAPFQYTHPEFDVFQFPAYSSPSLSNGNHTIRMQLDPALFDFFTYVSDPDAVSSSSASSTTGASESPGPTNTHNVGSPKAKAPVGAIAGGVIGGVALIALALVAFLFLRRRRHSGPSPKSVENHAVPFTGDKLPPGSTAQETDPPTLVEQVRLLHEQVQRLGVERDNAASGSSSSGGGGSSIGRSLSTMKSEQTRALRSHSGYANGASDSLTHTDSGLRLTAGRTVDEAPPPTYQAD